MPSFWFEPSPSRPMYMPLLRRMCSSASRCFTWLSSYTATPRFFAGAGAGAGADATAAAAVVLETDFETAPSLEAATFFEDVDFFADFTVLDFAVFFADEPLPPAAI